VKDSHGLFDFEGL